MAMQSLLSSLLMKPAPNPAGAPPMAPPPNALGVGAPPQLPGTPPPPEMIGQMPTGSTANSAKQAADVAIAACRDAKGFFPSMGDSLDAIVAQLQAAGAAQNAGPAPQVGQPGGPGAALPIVPPTQNSGAPGSV
jgi:hypothetical protein